MDIVSRNLDSLVYKRLDHLQHDLFTLLQFVREVASAESEAFEDSIDMQLLFIRKRDEMTKNGEYLFSPALHLGGRQVEKEAEEQRKNQPKPPLPANHNFIEINKMASASFRAALCFLSFEAFLFIFSHSIRATSSVLIRTLL